MTDRAKHTSEQTYVYRLITPNTLEDFRKHIAETNWTNVLATADANTAYDSFIKTFKSHYFSSFPIQTH